MKIGYLWQIDEARVREVRASPLHIKAVIRALEKRSHFVRLVTTPDRILQYSDDWENWKVISLGPFKNRLYKLFRSAVGFIHTKLRLPYFHLFDSMRYAYAARTSLEGFDMLYERYWLLNYGGLIASKRLGIPLILEINGDLFREYDLLGIELSKMQWRATRFINRQLFKRADHIVTVSEPLRDTMMEMWDLPPEKVTAINNGAHVDLFAADYDLTDLKEKYNITDEPIAVFVGTFKPWHGLDLVIEAFEKVAAQNDKARLVLVGDGPQFAEMQQLVSDKGLAKRIVFTGKIPHTEVPRVLKLAQVALVNPRLSPASAAQSPLKLFEYMAGGKAVIAPNVPNIQKIVDSGKNGILIEPNDAEPLSQAMLKTLSDQEYCQRLGQAAQEKALAEFSWDKTVEKIDEIMQRLLGERAL